MFQFAADFQRKRLICGCMARKFLASSLFALSLSACISAPDAPDRPVFEPASDTFSNADDVTIIVVRHPNNVMTVYYNVADVSVSKGTKVSREQTMAKVPAKNNFLHFEVRKGFEIVDPMPFLK